jgi:hypothetical protein
MRSAAQCRKRRSTITIPDADAQGDASIAHEMAQRNAYQGRFFQAKDGPGVKKSAALITD